MKAASSRRSGAQGQRNARSLPSPAAWHLQQGPQAPLWGAASGQSRCVVVKAGQEKGSQGEGREGSPNSGGGIGDWVRQLADFGSWAPKASRAWRLGQTPNDPNAEPDAVDDLQARLQQQAQPSASSSSASSSSNSNSALADRGANGSGAGLQDESGLELPPTGSFSEADDSVLSQMLSKRIRSLSGSMEEEPAGAAVADQPEVSAAASTEVAEEDQNALSGEEMRRLILAKYGKTYDVSLVRRDGFGRSFVALNITWQHLEQRSFRMTEEQFMEKINSVAYLLNLLGQSEKVRAFLKQPAKSERGLPRRPVVGTAISVQLDLPQNLIDEFFGSGYF